MSARFVIRNISGKSVAALEIDVKATVAELKTLVAGAAGFRASEIALARDDGEQMDDSRSLAQHGIEPDADAAQITVLVTTYTLETDEDALRLITKYKGCPNPRDWPMVMCSNVGVEGSHPAKRVTGLVLSQFRRVLLPPTIPPALGQLTKLTNLMLDSAGFSGRLPEELRTLTCLKQLDLSDNSLEGPLPPWIGDLASLRRLALAKNHLSGRIPAELGRLSNLQRLFLSNNMFEGPPPGDLGQLKHLEELWVDLSGDGELDLGDLERKLQSLEPECKIQVEHVGSETARVLLLREGKLWRF